MPSFYLAILSIGLFSVYFEILPIAGVSSGEFTGIDYILDTTWHLILPIFIMMIIQELCLKLEMLQMLSFNVFLEIDIAIQIYDHLCKT